MLVAKFNLEIFKRPVLWYVVAGWGGQQLDLVRYKIIISFQICKLPFGNMRSAGLTRLQWFTICRTWDHALYCNVIRCHILYCVFRIQFSISCSPTGTPFMEADNADGVFRCNSMLHLLKCFTSLIWNSHLMPLCTTFLLFSGCIALQNISSFLPFVAFHKMFCSLLHCTNGTLNQGDHWSGILMDAMSSEVFGFCINVFVFVFVIVQYLPYIFQCSSMGILNQGDLAFS